MRTIPVFTVVAAALLSVASPADAQGMPPVPVTGTLVVPTDFPVAHCAFPLQLDFNGKTATIALPDGGQLVTSPGLVVTATNVDVPTKTVRLVSTGTLTTTVAANGDAITVANGRNILLDPFAGVVLAIGHFSFAFDAQGDLVQPLTGTGQLVDICALVQ